MSEDEGLLSEYSWIDGLYFEIGYKYLETPLRVFGET